MTVASPLDGMTEVVTLPGLTTRPLDSHKGTHGSILVAAGSRLMPGAAVLAAAAAYRSGAGLVTVLTDAAVIPLVAAHVVETIFTDWETIGEKLAGGEPPGYDAVLVGPGLGLELATRDRERLVLELIGNAKTPVVLDADVLNLLAAAPDRELSNDLSAVWTPHPGEFRRLFGVSPRGDTERLESAARFVRTRGGVLVLKGHRTVIVDRSRYAINTTGNPGMATAGSGDVLAGVLVALLGQGYEPFDAARLAVHLHGSAGDAARESTGEISMTAGDILEGLSAAFLDHQAGTS